MSAWHRRYNISGTVHCDCRLDEWCLVLHGLLGTDDVGVMSYFTGEKGVFAISPIADVVSCGSGLHELHVLVHGEPVGWSRFADQLGSVLTAYSLPHSLIVHEAIQVLR